MSLLTASRIRVKKMHLCRLHGDFSQLDVVPFWILLRKGDHAPQRCVVGLTNLEILEDHGLIRIPPYAIFLNCKSATHGHKLQ